MGTCSSAEIYHSDTLPVLPTFKVVIVGDSRTGKTSVLNRFVKNQYSSLYSPTKNVDIVSVTKTLNVPEHMIVSLSLWDTPGRDDIDLTETYYKDIDAAIVVVDVTSEKCLEMASFWRQQIVNSITKHSELSTTEAYNIPVILLANKYDLVDKTKPKDLTDLEDFTDSLLENKREDNPDELRIITGREEEEWTPECVERVREIAEQHRFLSGIMVSAKESDGSVQLAIQTLVRNLIDKHYDEVYGPEMKKRRKRAKRINYDDDTSRILKLTGVESLDDHIQRCEEHVSRISELKSSYETALDKFKVTCADAEIIPAENYTRASLEQCITALKLHVGDSEDLSVEEMDDGLVKLYVAARDVKLDGDVARAINKFNDMFAVICAVILAEAGSLKSELKKYDRCILDSETELWQRYKDSVNESQNRNVNNQDAPPDPTEVASVVKANRVQIAESYLWIDELHRHAERARDKVKVALMW